MGMTTQGRIRVALGIALLTFGGLSLSPYTPFEAETRCDVGKHAEKPFYASYLAQFDGMLEQGNNRGEFIDKFNARYAYDRAPYCASGVSWTMDEMGVRYPFVRSARARAFIDQYAIKAWDVVTGKRELPDECLAVYIRKGGGHVDYVLRRIGRDSIELFGFNTSPDSDKGNRGWNGKWSGIKRRDLRRLCLPTSPYRITHFVPIIK